MSIFQDPAVTFFLGSCTFFVLGMYVAELDAKAKKSHRKYFMRDQNNDDL